MPLRMNLLASRRHSIFGLLIGMTLIIVIIFKMEILFKGEIKNEDKIIPVITCSPEDYNDTPFTTLVRNNETVIIPDDRTLEKLSREEMAALYHRYVENLQYFCKRIIRLGKVTDGGWDVCDDAQFRPKTPCVVYSFGINNDFSFDDDAIKVYGCEVNSFDPSMGIKSYQRSKLNYFYNVGIASDNLKTKDGWKLQDIGTIRRDLKHTEQKVTILKMDIETWEWDVIPSLVSGSNLNGVDNLLIEVHLNLYRDCSESDRKDYLRALGNLKLLFDAGFRIFRTHRNPTNTYISKCKRIERANCHELHMVRIKS